MPDDPQPSARTDADAAAAEAGLARLCASEGFRHSHRQQRLLRHIVEATLAGATERLKGYTLGVEVFDRGADFDPNVDPIVRVEAGRLRHKLLAYYAGEGASDTVRIEVPKGSYAARIEFRADAARAEFRSPERRRTPRADALGRLPAASERLIGREADLQALYTLLDEQRLVTLLGPGGVGKTRLAQALAQTLAQSVEGAVGWVDLAPIADAALLEPTLAQALGLSIAQSGRALPGLLAALRPRTMLIVLDNAEHLVDAIARLAHQLLEAAPGLRLLVTSQAPLHIAGEQVFRLAALAVPPAGSALADASSAGAVALFAERARAADGRFELSAANIAAVVRLCGRLDGLPLAIRLAAARVPLLGLSGLEARLDERLQLLAGEPRDVPPRQQALAAALEWSCSLLAPDELVLFERLGVFVGGFTLELAIGLGCDEGDDDWPLIGALQSLVERSLVEHDGSDPPRYRLLESQRAYALQRLDAIAGARHGAQQRHAKAVAAELAAALQALLVTSETRWLAAWAPEIDNVRAALDWSLQHDGETFVSIIGSTSPLFRLLDLGFELRRRAAAVDEGRVAAAPAALQALYWLARSTAESGISSPRVYEHAVRAEAKAREAGDAQLLYVSLCQRVGGGMVSSEQTPAALAEIAALESPLWPARLRSYRCVAECVAANLDGRWPAALAAAEAGFALGLAIDSRLLKAMFANWIVVAHIGLDDVAGADRHSSALWDHVVAEANGGIGPSASTIPFLGTSARCAFMLGDFERAERLLAQMFALCRIVEWAGFAYFANLYLELAIARSRLDDGARLLGYADAAACRAWPTLRSSERRAAARGALVAAMGEERVASLAAEGAGLDEETVCRLALAGAAAPT